MKLFIPLFAGALLFAACDKGNDPVAPGVSSPNFDVKPTPIPPPSLTGEVLTANNQVVPGDICPDCHFTVSMDCSDPENVSGTFSAKGFAAGPYPGLFEETGHLTGHLVDPATLSTLFIETFEADFVITSATGQVEGHKSQVEPADVLSTCGNKAFALGPAAYTANITTTTGSFNDQGMVATTSQFVEHFSEGPFASELGDFACDKLKDHPNDPLKDRCKDK